MCPTAVAGDLSDNPYKEVTTMRAFRNQRSAYRHVRIGYGLALGLVTGVGLGVTLTPTPKRFRVPTMPCRRS